MPFRQCKEHAVAVNLQTNTERIGASTRAAPFATERFGYLVGVEDVLVVRMVVTAKD